MPCYRCESCERLSEEPGYCVHCLTEHAFVSEAVSRIDSKAPSVPVQPLSPPTVTKYRRYIQEHAVSLTPYEREYLEALDARELALEACEGALKPEALEAYAESVKHQDCGNDPCAECVSKSDLDAYDRAEELA